MLGAPNGSARDLPCRLGVEALRRGGTEEDDRAVRLQVRLIDAVAVDCFPHPVAADDCDDDAHNVLGALHTTHSNQKEGT